MKTGNIIDAIPEKLALAEEPLTENNIGYIYYMFNYNSDPFEDSILDEKQNVKENKKTRLI